MSLGAAARPLAVIDESREAGTAVLTGRQIECTIIHNGNTDLQITLPSDVTVPDRFRIGFSVSQREALAELDWQEGSTARIWLLTAPKPIRLPGEHSLEPRPDKKIRPNSRSDSAALGWVSQLSVERRQCEP